MSSPETTGPQILTMRTFSELISALNALDAIEVAPDLQWAKSYAAGAAHMVRESMASVGVKL